MKRRQVRRQRARRLPARGSQDPDRARRSRTSIPRCGSSTSSATRSSCTPTAIPGLPPRRPMRRSSSRASRCPFDEPLSRRPASSARAPAASSPSRTAYRDLFIDKKRATHPLTLLRIIGSSAAAHVGIEFGVKGPTFATCSACSTATHAIGIGRDYIRTRLVDVAIAGASESGHHLRHHEGLAGPARAVAGGLLPVRQEAQRHRARRRRRHPGAGIAGARQGAWRQDPGRARRLRHVLRRQGHGQPRHRGPERGHALALEDAKLSPSDIDYLNAHGTATTINDINETRAIKEVFGNHAKNLAISSTKSMHGHPLGAGGSIEAVACIKAMNENWVPPTIGLDDPDPDAISTTFPTSAATSTSPTRCRTRSPSAASTRC